MTAEPTLPDPPWSTDDAFPRYSAAEYEARWRSIRAILATFGASGALVAGHATGRAEIQFLTNAPVRWESLLVVPVDERDTPRLLVQLDNHASGTRPWSTVPVEVTGPALASRAAELVLEHGAAAAPVAVLGPMSERLATALRASLGAVPTVSIASPFLEARLIKSDEELRWTRYGATICDGAVAAFLDEARPGMREDELGAVVTSAVARAGGQLTICFLATASMQDGGAVAPNQTWSRRRTGRGDLVMFELSAGFGGATGQVLRTVSLGDEPTPIVRELHEIAEQVAGTLQAAIGPGLRVAELEAIGGAVEAAGFTIVDDLVHGYGGGYLPPHVRTPATRREDPGDAVLAAGQLLVIQPNVVTNDLRHGVQTGGLVEVTAEGAVPLHDAPPGLLRLPRREGGT